MNTQAHQYDPQFYRYINRGAVDSASAIIPVLRGLMPVSSVLDVGCGAGAWLSVWKEHDAGVCGLDGDYVDRKGLLIDEAEFLATDLTQPFDVDRRFDLVQCLEVAEHLDKAVSAQFVACLCNHSDAVLFSAAPPGQGGENHVNEQPYAYWRAHFDQQGFQMYDAVRPAVRDLTSVMPWYRYNTFLYVRRGAREALHTRLVDCRVEAGDVPPDVSPLVYRLRKRLVALLPVAAMTGIATVKKHLAPRVGLKG